MLIRWVAAGIAAIFITDAVSLVVQQSGALLQVISFVVFIVTLGLAQWLVLRLYLDQITWRSWLAATTLGQILGLLLASVQGFLLLSFGVGISLNVFLYISLALVFVAGGVISGICIGFMQWRVLRHYFAGGRESIWLMSNIAAEVVIAILPPPGIFVPDDVARSALSIVAGALGAYITGRALLRLMAHVKTT